MIVFIAYFIVSVSATELCYNETLPVIEGCTVYNVQNSNNSLCEVDVDKTVDLNMYLIADDEEEVELQIQGKRNRILSKFGVLLNGTIPHDKWMHLSIINDKYLLVLPKRVLEFDDKKKDFSSSKNFKILIKGNIKLTFDFNCTTISNGSGNHETFNKSTNTELSTTTITTENGKTSTTSPVPTTNTDKTKQEEEQENEDHNSHDTDLQSCFDEDSLHCASEQDDDEDECYKNCIIVGSIILIIEGLVLGILIILIYKWKKMNES